ncbi:MAG: hypothetical protein WCD70_08065, partial [Alphaproteobacteria bacterium]
MAIMSRTGRLPASLLLLAVSAVCAIQPIAHSQAVAPASAQVDQARDQSRAAHAYEAAVHQGPP